MPIETDAARLRRFVMSHTADRELAKKALFLIRPFFEDAAAGGYPLSPSWSVDDDAFIEALNGVSGAAVDKLTPISSGKNRGCLAQFLDHEQITRLPMFVMQAHRRTIDGVWEEDRYQEFVYLFYECLGGAMMLNLRDSHLRFFEQLDEELANDIPFIPVVCVFYLLIFAMFGDRERYGKFASLVRLLGQAIPIGESGKPGEWLMLVS